MESKEPEKKSARELQEAVYLLELQKAQFSALENQLQLLDITYNDNLRAKETLTNYDKLSEGSEILMPIGGDIFLYSKVYKKGKALAEIGGDIVVEKSVEEATELVEARLKELESARAKILEQAQKAQENIAKLTEKVRILYEAQR
ncbi:MAG: prefoldin subunit alpha [Candidatus Thermoplasmatota archaeon]